MSKLPDAPFSAPAPTIAGYRIGGEAGHCPLGVSYHAVHEATGTAVLFRGLPSDPADQTLLPRLCAAYQQIALLPDAPPALAPLHGWGLEADGLFWIASEAFPGRTLHQIRHGEGAKSLPWAIAVMEQVAAGVDFLHAHGLPHLDLSPTNVQVADFGDGRPVVRVLHTGLAYNRNPFGLRFTPPERQNGGPGNPAGDVWASGALLFELLTNRPVFDGLSLEEVAKRVRQEPPLFPREMPEYVQKVLGKLLHKDPLQRYSTVSAAIADLAAERAPNAGKEAVSVPAAPPPPLPFVPDPTAPLPTRFPPLPPAVAPDEFTKLALDPSRLGTPSPSARRKKWGVFWVPDTPAPPDDLPISPLEHETAPLLQQFTVAQQKQSIVQWRMERLRYDAEENLRRHFGSRQAKTALRTGAAAVAVVAALTGHAVWSLNGYRTVTVSGMTGKATVTVGSSTRPLHVGETVAIPDSGELPVIACPPDTRIMLTVRGARLHLLGDSALELRELSYHNGGPVRRFGLRRGQVIAWVNPRHREGAVFEIRTGEVRAIAKGTRFSVAAVTTAATKKTAASTSALVSTDEGRVRVARENQRGLVAAGHQLTIGHLGAKTDTALPKPALLAAAAQTAFAASRKAMDGMSGDNDANALGDGWGTLLSLGEEKALLPLAEGAQTLLHLPTFLNDRRAVVLAMGSMQALVTLLQTVDENTPPEEVHLETIAELGMPDADRQRILANFVGGRLESYHRLPGGGYEFLAHAKDEAGTLIRGRNGAVSVVGNDDTE